jgi:two-component system, OmpR family, sensor kinase
VPRRIVEKWRPPLSLVLGGVLGAVMLAPLAGVAALGLLAPSLGFRQSALAVTAAVLLITAILGYLLWRLLLRPVTALALRAEALRAGDATALDPLDHYGTRELRNLAESILGMAAELHDRELAIRSFADHVSHELKTPMTTIRGAAELVELGADTQENRQLLHAIGASVARTETLLSALRRTAGARDPRYRGQCCLADILAALTARFPGLELVPAAPRLPLPLAPDGLLLALTHLIENAAEHGARRVTLTPEAGRGNLSLTVRDDGGGISDGNRPEVFKPFFTTRRDRGGTGMGLAIVRGLLVAHGADIRLLPSAGGAVFVIDF